MPGEAVTVQLGHYAGCVGAHWWGLQAAALLRPDAAELRSSALLRAGRDARTPRTPRLVALELKGGVGALGPGGTAGEPGAPATWDGDVADYRESSGGGSAPRAGGDSTENAPSEGKGGSSASVPGAAPARDGPVRLWSDYLNVRLHPKSLYVIPQYMHDGECGVLEAFGQGERLLQDPGCLEELEDRLHFYVEECDYLQGFQVLCDLHDGFSGVGAKVTELLYDEYSGKGILTWGLTPLASPGDHRKDVCRLLNTVLGTVHLARHSSLLCPLSLSGTLGIKPQPPVTFPYIDYDASLNYHSSAILAAALDTLTAPYRLRAAPGSMAHLAESLHFSGRKVVAAWASLPFPVRCGLALPDILGARGQDVPWEPLSSCRDPKLGRCFAQSVVLRGIREESGGSRPGQPPASPLHACGVEETLQRYLHGAFPGAFSTCYVLEQPCPTLPPFPQFFSPLLSGRGFLLDKPPARSSAAVESVPVLAALQSAPVLHQLLWGLRRDARRLNTRRWASFFAAGVEQDDFQEALEELGTLAQCYQNGFRDEDDADSD
ncbi:protein misato homolog 1 isoform X2 [Caloenas nicobarica]|uniref:protein misato homolog 1 isoform X2 n=1 Tax=Caloenas nicobarica TaxID=187106 RepID=UPI0032B77438